MLEAMISGMPYYFQNPWYFNLTTEPGSVSLPFILLNTLCENVPTLTIPGVDLLESHLLGAVSMSMFTSEITLFGAESLWNGVRLSQGEMMCASVIAK
jgi:hypothetical protein